ncbi:MAG: CopG family transcriptional regulator [Steroidobacteraceae bacterium]
MVNRAKPVGRPASQKPRSIRASVSLPPDIYRSIEALARQKKVSAAWVLRDAAEKYIDNQWPLIGRP